MSEFPTLTPPYFAVIFSSKLSGESEGYEKTAGRMVDLAKDQPGFLGIDSVREGGTGLTVSYWKDKASIEKWKQNAEHLAAQKAGQEKWYESYKLRIALVEKEYGSHK